MIATSVRRGYARWFVEFPVLVVGYLCFGLARARVGGGDPAGTLNALLIQWLERTLHLAIEQPINHAVTAHLVAVYATGWFYRFCVLGVPATLIWLYATHRDRYVWLRNVVIVVMLIDLPLVALFPVSPPRFALAGVVDYMTEYDILGSAATSAPRPGLNPLAAMPSMHMAWTTWCAFAIWSALHRERPFLAQLAWLLPAVTAFVVLATGHHYVLDIVGGVGLVGVVAGAARLWSRWWSRSRDSIRATTARAR